MHDYMLFYRVLVYTSKVDLNRTYALRHLSKTRRFIAAINIASGGY